MIDTTTFFHGNHEKVALYAHFIGRLSHLGSLKIKQRKSNSILVLCNKKNFGYIIDSDSDENIMTKGFTIVFSLRRMIDSPCILRVTQPYPNRWSHHVVIDSKDAINDKLIEWIEESYYHAG